MRFRKKPVVIEAVQWNVPDNMQIQSGRDCKDHPAVRGTSYMEVHQLLGTSGCSREHPYWDWSVMGAIDTIEGVHIVTPGDWIITGVAGEHYPCRPDIFEKTYEPAP